MEEIAWADGLEKLRKYCFKISTPSGSGTGFIIKCANINNIYGIATAYHIIRHSHAWEEPIKVIHELSGKQLILRAPERFIWPSAPNDIAIIMFTNKELELPTEELRLTPADKHIKPGIRIGWVGYPAVAPDNLSFFSGAISCFLGNQLAYLVDGVAINGVSGGPAFIVSGDLMQIVGIVSAYIPNRVTGESLPGVCFIVGIQPFHEVIRDIKSIEEAQAKAKEIEKESTPSLPEEAGPTSA